MISTSKSRSLIYFALVVSITYFFATVTVVHRRLSTDITAPAESQVRTSLRVPPRERRLRTNLREISNVNGTSCSGRISIAHTPRYDMAGSFVLPTILLLAIAHHHDWNLEIRPYAGSAAEKQLEKLFRMGHELNKVWPGVSTGMNDASNRVGYDPVQVNKEVYDALAFFPKESKPWQESLWTPIENIPDSDETLDQICFNQTTNGESNNSTASTTTTNNGCPKCRLYMGDLPYPMLEHMHQHGGIDAFFTKSLRATMHRLYIEKNRHRLKHFSSQDYNVAIHVRRGDILKSSDRWTEQSTFANVARRICSNRKQHANNTVIHVFSSGLNPDGDWSKLEQVRDTCKDVTFHLDEYEYDTWAHLTAADELVISKSTFGYVPALISMGTIHTPHDFWHNPLAHWEKFRNSDGEKIG